MNSKLFLLSLSLVIPALTGCGPSNPQSQSADAEHFGNSKLIEHIKEEHGLWIGEEADAMILVSKTNQMIRVHFSDDILKQLPPDCLPVLRFNSPTKTFSEEEYEQFLQDLHDYLVLTYGEGGKVNEKRDDK